MPYTRTNLTLNSTITQQNLYDTIKARFVAAGYTLVSEFTIDTNKAIVFRLTLDSTKIYSRIFLRIRVTTDLIVYQQIYTSWDTVTSSGNFPSTESAGVTFANNVAIDFVSLVSSPEYRFVILSQGIMIALLGILRPGTKPTFWSEDSFPYAFINGNNWDEGNMFRTWFSCASSPYGNVGDFTSNMADSRLSRPNPLNNLRDSQAGMILFSGSQGIAGQTSNDFLSVAAVGQTRFEEIIFTAGVEEYLLLNPNYGAMALRKV
jgi:hypothetical protein